MNTLIGRAKTVLVFGPDSSAVALLTSLVAQWTNEAGNERLTFKGPLRFSDETEQHIRTMVLPLVDQIVTALGLSAGRFEMSGVNLGAASSSDVGVEITGFSADLPLFLALLSARLAIPLPQDAVSTGHIASSDGDIRMVRNLPAKLLAARQDSSIRQFVYPDLKADVSIETLAPSEFEQVQAALSEACRDVAIIGVRDVAEFLKSILPEEAIVRGALETGHVSGRLESTQTTPLSRATRFLGADIPKRFMEVLRSTLHEDPGPLLERWIHWHVTRESYPRGFGRKLRSLLNSVPPQIRSRFLRTPLIPVQLCIALSQCAAEADFDDVLELYRSVGRPGDGSRHPRSLKSPRRSNGKSSAVEIAILEIEKEHLARTIGLPIDAARASFTLESVSADSHAEFMDVVTSFYIHLLRHTHRLCGTGEDAGPGAHQLLSQSFASAGGVPAAVAEARFGTRGGLRFVLDQMTEQFKRERQEDHVLHVVSTTLDPLDFAGKVKFMKEFLVRYPDAVPAELAREPPERFAAKYDVILRAYVSSMDQMKQLLRTF